MDPVLEWKNTAALKMKFAKILTPKSSPFLGKLFRFLLVRR